MTEERKVEGMKEEGPSSFFFLRRRLYYCSLSLFVDLRPSSLLHNSESFRGRKERDLEGPEAQENFPS